MKSIALSQGKISFVDDDDFEDLSVFHWSYCKTGYAMRGYRANGKTWYLKMHHAIIGRPRHGYEVDHINGNRLDNRKVNLRIVTVQQNQFNRKNIKRYKSSSSYKGVSRNSGRQKWRSRIMVNGRDINLGCFPTEREAALAYNKAAEQYFGIYANLNNFKEDK